MQSRWDDSEASEFVDRLAEQHGTDVALRVYSSRLIGRDRGLVLHGGGNTSVKSVIKDLVGDSVEVLCVKGSGWDLVDIEPAGLPAVRIEPLRRLRVLEAMTDEQMVNQVRGQLLDVTAPTPSVEALLHAYLPHKFVDHTHADAILVLTNQPDGEELVREALGSDVVILPWIMPGFPLAKAVADAYDENPECRGVVLMHHGIFTFGDDAKSSYEAMIEFVDKAERFAEKRAPRNVAAVVEESVPPTVQATAADVLPTIRGAVATERDDGSFARLVADFRTAPDLRAISERSDCAELLSQAPLTPDHVLRTKGPYLWMTEETARNLESCNAAADAFAHAYETYYRTHARDDTTMLDCGARVVVVEGVGLIGLGPDPKSAAIAADIAEHTLRCKAQGAEFGRYVSLSPAKLFEMEYWSLEQAKLQKNRPARLASQVALVTGAAGAIGHGVAEALLDAGAHVMLTDIDEKGLERVREMLAARFGARRVRSHVADVVDGEAVQDLFDACALAFGGVDIVVPNAGLAYVSTLRDMEPAKFDRVVDVNLGGTMQVLRIAAKTFEKQGTGGSVVIQASKNVFAPGPNFGAYSASKAGAHQLGKIAALEFAEMGVTVNMVNADAVFGADVESKLWAEVGPDRMKSRGLDEDGLRDFYRERSLLKREVTPAHVGAAVVFFAEATTLTTGATLPVDAGVPGAFPR